jgi:hypothetical protein
MYTFLYYIQINCDDNSYYKIGISTNLYNRCRQLERKHKGICRLLDVAKMLKINAISMEATIKRHNKAALAPIKGNTEVFLSDILNKSGPIYYLNPIDYKI